MDEEPRILARSGDATIAYRRTAGKAPGVVFCPGFMSDMTGEKAVTLEALCRERGHAYVRFDYQGHGESSGAFADGTIGLWAADAIAVVDELTEGPQILVGSSMGGWIMLLTALARAERVAALVGIAAAPDFTKRLWEDELSTEQRAEIETQGRTVIPSAYDDDYTFTKALIDDGNAHLVLDKPIPLDVPVRLLHGMGDDAVPWQTALKIQEQLTGDDVEVTFVKNGDHRLSESADLKRLRGVVSALLDSLGA
jgi:pimeloyl-ACP methyl ester carboxylesterase